MLRIKATGTKKDLVWFRRKIERCASVEILRISGICDIPGSQMYHRMDIEASRKRGNVKEKMKRPSGNGGRKECVR